MGGVKHGGNTGNALPVRAAAVAKVVVHFANIVVILRFGVGKLAKRAFFVLFAAKNGVGVIVAGFGHHVNQAGFFYQAHNFFNILNGAGNRHGRKNIFAGL